MKVIIEESSSQSSLALTSLSDPFQQVFHTDESIREFLSLDELPWDDLHHRSSFYLNLIGLKMIFHLLLQFIISRNHRIQSRLQIQILRLIWEKFLQLLLSTYQLNLELLKTFI